ncbi:RNA-binding transcriptional accessory protein, partial [Ruminococcaceae bacterium OttesenSCG-928-N02]|nr:RNA-binding transcriptional accessory protein [Ruminococcaceae bacterium OttesenSCG-928-N02]
MTIEATLASELNLNPRFVQNTIALLDEGNTVPFVARYRKEATGEMDDQTLRKLADRLTYLRGLAQRKEEVRTAIEGQEKLTDEIVQALESAKTLAEVEDIYRPYKQKRKTRASVARARGLGPLAQQIMLQTPGEDPAELAGAYVNEELEVADTLAAIAGASDIIAEDISDDATIRAALRRFYMGNAHITSKAAKEEDSVYANYYEYEEPLARVQHHRILALDRGEREGFLKVAVTANAEKALEIIHKATLENDSPCAQLVRAAGEDSYARLLHPSLEREMRSTLSEAAAEGAIAVFAQNLRQLLLQPPIKGKVALGLDPGYRMGCKTAVVDPTGKV